MWEYAIRCQMINEKNAHAQKTCQIKKDGWSKNDYENNEHFMMNIDSKYL